MVAYLSMLLFPRNLQHYVTIYIGVAITLVIHMYLYMIKDNSFGLSSSLMTSFVRQYCISLNYKDGGEDNKKLTARELAHALKEIPAFTDYVSYMLFVSTCLVGPFIEYKPFIEWANLEVHYGKMPTLGQIPMLLRRLSVFTVTVFTTIILSNYISFDYMLTPEFANHGFFYKAAYLIGSI